MSNLPIAVLRKVYEITPFSFMRTLYFHAFCRLMRNKKVKAEREGIIFDLDLSEYIDMSIYLNRFEPEVTAAIQKYCRPGWTVFDIGANIGAHALRFAKLTGSNGKVYAFEPTNYAYRKLINNLSLNSFPHVRAIQVALADKIQAHEEINFRSSWRTDGTRADAPNFVDFTKLDHWCEDNDEVKVDLIKMDVDGNEFPILKGGENIIERCRPIMLLEVVSPHFEKFNENPFRLLKDLDYRFWDLRSGQEYTSLNDMKKRLPDRDFEMTVSFNVIASTQPLS